MKEMPGKPLIPFTLGLFLIGYVSGSSNHLVIIDAERRESFNLIVSTIQKLDFDSNSTLTVCSTSHDKVLLKKDFKGKQDEDWKLRLAQSSFSITHTERLDLTRLYNLYSGHFNNDDKDHQVSEIVTIFTDKPCVCGDVSFIDKMRKKKTFIVAVGFPKTGLCHVYKDIAATADHIFDIQNGASLTSFLKVYRIKFFEDKKHTCDTDMFKQPTYKRCSNKCSASCATTILKVAGYCKNVCPYYTNVNITALRDSNQLCQPPKIDETKTSTRKSAGSIQWYHIAIAVGGVFLVVTISVFLYKWNSSKEKLIWVLRWAKNKIRCRNESQPRETPGGKGIQETNTDYGHERMNDIGHEDADDRLPIDRGVEGVGDIPGEIREETRGEEDRPTEEMDPLMDNQDDSFYDTLAKSLHQNDHTLGEMKCVH